MGKAWRYKYPSQKGDFKTPWGNFHYDSLLEKRVAELLVKNKLKFFTKKQRFNCFSISPGDYGTKKPRIEPLVCIPDFVFLETTRVFGIGYVDGLEVSILSEHDFVRRRALRGSYNLDIFVVGESYIRMWENEGMRYRNLRPLKGSNLNSFLKKEKPIIQKNKRRLESLLRKNKIIYQKDYPKEREGFAVYDYEKEKLINGIRLAYKFNRPLKFRGIPFKVNFFFVAGEALCTRQFFLLGHLEDIIGIKGFIVTSELLVMWEEEGMFYL